MKELPNKLSDLLEVALEDLGKCEKDERYFIDMGDWHEPFHGGRCSVCMTGAVMAKSLDVRSSIQAYPSSFDVDTMNKLLAINDIVFGSIWKAIKLMNPTTDRLQEAVALMKKKGDAYFDPMSYSRNPRMFKVDIQRIIKALRKYKL